MLKFRKKFRKNFVKKFQKKFEINLYFQGQADMDEKLDSVQLEYTFLLTSRLESQRNFFESKISHLQEQTEAKISQLQEQAQKQISHLEEQVKAATVREHTLIQNFISTRPNSNFAL